MESSFFNLPLFLGICSIVFAQMIKVPLHFIATKKWDLSLFTSTGGMPSSHSAGVMSVATAVGFEAGFQSPLFAVASMLAGIVMYDASGVRYQAGQHARILNEIRTDLQTFFYDIQRWPQLNEKQKIEELKTLLGHKRSEVFFGALLGITVSTITYITI